MKKKLDILRKKIDLTDKALLELLAKRIALVREVGELKKEYGIQPLDEKRWKALLSEKLTKAKLLNLSEEFVEKLYNLIHKHALDLQRDLAATVSEKDQPDRR